MSILLGILLYVLCIAFFCTLTGINHLDASEPESHRARELALAGESPRAGRAAAREAHG